MLIDIRMPGLDGIEATRRIIASGARTRILIVTTFDLDAYAYDGLRAGASGFLVKDALPEELLAGIRAVAVGDAVVAPTTEIAARLHLAESTVKTHVTRILAKTGPRDRVQAVILAYDTRLVTPA